MAKTITRHAAETSLTIAGATELPCEHSDGAGELSITVRRRGSKLRLSVEIYELRDDEQTDAIDATGDWHPFASFVADVDPTEFCELLTFERTMQSMTAGPKLPDHPGEWLARDEVDGLVCWWPTTVVYEGRTLVVSRDSALEPLTNYTWGGRAP